MEKITVFEAFAGYGSQSMALEKLKQDIGLDYEVVGISEIDPTAIKAYYAARDPELTSRCDTVFDLENVIRGGYQPPKELVEKYPNYGDITLINWEEVPDFNLFTYSFPCTDISNAGLQKGLAEGSGTRSSLLWECARAIELKRPKYLLMENVKALVSDKFMPDFKKWAKYLENLGYSNHYQVLNAKDYGVPQNRERVFMVSILGEAIYYFPKPFKLDRRLKHVLETDVDESYYLSDEKIQAIIDHCERKQAEGCGFKTNFQTGGIAEQSQAIMGNEKLTLTSENEDGIIVVGKMNNSQDGKIVDADGIAPTHTSGHGNCPKVLVNTPPKTICLNSKDETGKQPSIHDRVYDSNGIVTALTTGWHPCVTEYPNNQDND